MENQVNVGDQNSQQIGQNPVSQPVQIPDKPKINYWMISTLILFVVLVIGGLYTFSLRKKIPEEQNNKQTRITTPTSSPVTTATNSPVVSPTATTSTCKDISSLAGYQYCDGKSGFMSSYITTPKGLQIKHVSKYSVSPNKEWVFVVRFSDAFAASGGAPDENALTMIDLKNLKEYELFSQIYFPNYQDPESWSLDGKGIVFTAGEAATPNILGNPNMFAVVYCTTSCKVLAKNAGPAGIGGDPAYFESNEVRYTGMNGEEIKIPFK